MKKFLFAYAGCLLAMLVLDGIWLGALMAPTYRALLGTLMLDQPLLVPAALFYLLYALGCTVFVALPASTWQRAARLGALLGLVAYGTYDLSNWATLRDWPVQLVMLDMAWGAVATCIACVVGYLAARKA